MINLFLTDPVSLGKNPFVKKNLQKYIDFNSVEKSQGKTSVRWKVNKDMPFFEGHFPTNPILPAICIIDISLHLLSLSYPHISMFELELKRSKFMAMVHPDQEVIIEAQSEDEKSWSVLWSDAEDQQKLAQINLVI